MAPCLVERRPVERAVGVIGASCDGTYPAPIPRPALLRRFRQSACRFKIGQFTLELAGSCEAFVFADLPPAHVEQIRPLGLSHREAQTSGRQQLHALESETQHVHRVPDGAMKVAIYARYSSDNQRDASIADQLRICREFAARQGWTVVQEFTDHAISGATLLRAGFQALMRDALNRRFDVVLAESLDRFSRDQEDTAGLFKRLTFAGVNIVTLAEGDITHLHIGFKGTMNALFLKDLAAKTHRGLRGRIEDGKSAGGLCYGYRVVKAFSGGNVTTGEREIELAQAQVVERIFRDFIAGVSPKQIAKNLNREGVPGPFGGAWSPSTIYGNAKRGTGILNNELYVGRLIWNRLRYVKNPDTGKRVSRLNPSSEWMSKDVPELRIVPEDVWTAAKARQQQTRHAMTSAGRIGVARRPQYLFSGLTKCGICGAGFIMSGKNRLGCFGARDQGRCDNHLHHPPRGS